MKTTRITVENSASILAFESTGSEYYKKWDRFLTVEGKPAYHIGNTCGTCAFFFERLEGANQSISPTEISDRLRQGLKYLDLPHYPRTEYYRARTKNLGEGRELFEFLIPMFPANWLKADECNAYEILIGSGGQPTALALSVLDIKQASESAVNEHWCLAHYLLDGHHKMYAASVTGKPITLLSFLSLGESLATEENFRVLTDY